MKIPTNLFKFSFIALGWTVFILLSYVAFKDEKANALITMKDSYVKQSTLIIKND